MTVVGEVHGPFQANETEDPGEIESRQRLHCRRRPRCVDAAQGWSGFSCINSAGEHCQNYQRVDLDEHLAAELVALSAFATWIIATENTTTAIGQGRQPDHARAERRKRRLAR